jgi:hypothetical protein
MTKRFIDSDMWSDAFFEELGHKAKLLFIYLITCSHTSQAGIGQTTDKKIAAETDLLKNELPALFDELAEKVERQGAWYWIKNFTKHQTGNNSFLKAAVKYARKTPFCDAFMLQNTINESELFNNKQPNQYINKYNINQHSTGGAYTVATPCLQGVGTMPHENAHVLLVEMGILCPAPLEIEHMNKAINAGVTLEIVKQFKIRKPEIAGLKYDWQLNELMAQKKIADKNKNQAEIVSQSIDQQLEAKYGKGGI